MIVNMIGRIVMLEGILLLLPTLVALCYGERANILCFAVTVVVAMVVGILMQLIFKPKTKVIYAREGFIIVAFAWIILSVIGAVPFVLSGEIPNIFDALFETVSGFTTTGATILTDVESMSKSILFWRSFTHWLGGMGVLVLIMAIMPSDSGRAIHILRAEMAGPVVGKLTPKIKDTAKILYTIYLVITFTEFVLLWIGGMDMFESAVHALGTAGTGGFGVKADSLASYNPFVQWVITAFMLIFGINFNLFFFMIHRKFKPVFTNRELWFYGALVLTAGGILTFSIYPVYNNFSDSIRHAMFQTASIMSTTGYATADFNTWPSMARCIIFVLLFVGGCAGSTAGGLKLSRVMILFKTITRDIKKMLHPRTVSNVKMEGKPLDNEITSSVTTYFALYMGLITITFLVISFEPFSLETNLTAAISCVNNVGPGLDMVGPMGGYANYSSFSKFILTVAMLFGRLEIYPLLLAFYPRTWMKK